MDRHLNLFVSYNHDLTEDNLTRAFIVTLSLLSTDTNHIFLKTILSRSQYSEKLDFEDLFEQDLNSIQFALQGNIEIERKKIFAFPHKYLVTITGNNDFAEVDDYLSTEEDVEKTLLKREPPKGSPQFQLLKKLCSDSRPDGWIYNKDKGFVFLIESKTANSILYYSQVISHAYNWLGLSKVSEILERTIKIRWSDIANSIDRLIRMQITESEKRLLKELSNYLEYNGFKAFKGLQWNKLKPPPQINVFVRGFDGFRWSELKYQPEINILRTDTEDIYG